jgi:hypothetical protein
MFRALRDGKRNGKGMGEGLIEGKNYEKGTVWKSIPFVVCAKRKRHWNRCGNWPML